MTPSEQNQILGFIEAMGGLSKLAAPLSLAQRIARLLSRQYYGLTGMVPREVGMTAAERLKELARLGVGEPGAAAELAEAYRTGRHIPSATARLEAAKEKVETLPGFLKGLLKKPGKTISVGWRSHTPLGKVVILGAPAVPLYGAITGSDIRPGESIPGRIAEEVGRTTGFGVTGMLPAIPGLGVGLAAGKAGKTLIESLAKE